MSGPEGMSDLAGSDTQALLPASPWPAPAQIARPRSQVAAELLSFLLLLTFFVITILPVADIV